MTSEELKNLIDTKQTIVVDVRSKEVHDISHIPGSIHIPLTVHFASDVAKFYPSLSEFIILYCTSGTRSAQAMEDLRAYGYKNVQNFGPISNYMLPKEGCGLGSWSTELVKL